MNITVEAIFIECIIDGINIVIGMDAITELRGLTISDYKVKFGIISYAACTQTLNCCRIVNKNFKADFDGKTWTVAWNWMRERPVVNNKVACFKNSLKEEREVFEKDVEQWLTEGILLP